MANGLLDFEIRIGLKKKQYLDMTRLIKDKILKYAIRLMMYNERM